MKHVLAIAILAALATLTACKDGQATGHLEAKGVLGDWTLESGKCYSGQRQQYYGAIAYGADDTGIAVKLVKDPIEGWTVVVNQAPTCAKQAEAGGCKAKVVARNDCKTFDVAVSNTNTTINNIKEVEGHANLDCTTADYELHGKLAFDSCH
jgi:hypothetical protein